ncbi:hypothetical protein KSF_032340 [Reticulibacter mediterranei]|uniref:GyrI-like small molecule binding domain-containing protein n=1 Tax=Reticulibacter mediterranei TaxID=2778369 RepID=A0A8J3IPT1_9CHLR|nr:GyrI-like domain-containing protein [Reticulibacter mediterranei]GHO93186.1 hypothetical protein KSF_032340 [Reticulibacter mediterranei]
MATIDLKKQLKHLYQPSAGEIAVVEVPTMNFLMLDGSGDPNGTVYADAVGALYAVAYALKFMLKKRDAALDYTVMPLEGLWRTREGTLWYDTDRANWLWTAMIMQPEEITEAMFEQARSDVGSKKRLDLASMRFEAFTEGRAAQILHAGPYSEERPTIERLHAFLEQRGWRANGRHHEIYLNDPFRTAPERLRTILRQPFAE